MLWPQKVTIFGLFAFGLGFSTLSHATPVSLSVRMAGQGKVAQTTSPNAALAASLEYNFYESYLVGVEYSYLRPFTHFQDYMNNGMNDMAFYLGDSKLWADKALGLEISARVGGILPTSMDSRDASLRYGITAQVSLKKTFTRRFSMSYRLSGSDYDHHYATSSETPESVIYNTRWDVNNRFSMNYKLSKSVSVDTAFLVSVNNDYNDVTYNIYQLSGGLNWNVAKFATLDVGFRTKMRDMNGAGTYVGSSAAETLFDPTGTTIYVGATINI